MDQHSDSGESLLLLNLNKLNGYNSPAILCALTSVFAAIPSVQGHLNELCDSGVTPVSSTVSAQVHVVFVVRASDGRKLALKRLAVNNDADVYLTKQEIAVTKALSDCSYSVTYISSITKQISSDVHEVLILMELYTCTSEISLSPRSPRMLVCRRSQRRR
ncbi:uncharacterized protein LOC135332123 [Halichondria panicea]|uniref:uncharacterized protein LOC135332123 n=1 Tax=Halichondria panicea TaxID=6063 RepID=UPI00312B7A5F